MARKNSNQYKPAYELNQQSMEYLGVSKQPFANEILSEDSFFNFQALEKISDSLVHQVQFSELLLLIEGINGAGKTAFFRQFIQLEIANTKTLAIHAEATDTLVQIQQKMSIHLQDLGDANHLDDNLKSLQMFDQTPLAVINNSHVLSDTTLQELLRYQQQLKQQDVSLKLLLFANTGMHETLQKITDIQPDQMYVQSLPEFSPKQASAFIMHRLRCAGYFGEIILDDNAITQLYKTCNGSPLDIMIQATPLIDKAIKNILKPTTTPPIKTLIAFVILFILIGGGYGGYVFFEPTNADSTDSDLVAGPASTETTRPDVIEILENDTISHKDSLTLPDGKPENDAEIFAAETTSLDSSATADDAISSENFQEPLHIAVNEPVNEPMTAPEIIETNINEPEMNQAKVNQPEPANKTQSTVQPQTTTQPVSKIKPKPNKWIAEENSASQLDSNLKLNPTLLQLKTMGLHDASWLLQQNSQNWTLQLIGAREPKTLLKFAQRNNLSNNAAWYKTWLTSKPYYVMVYGSFASRDEAREAISSLAPALQSLKPWVKSMKSVQDPLQ